MLLHGSGEPQRGAESLFFTNNTSELLIVSLASLARLFNYAGHNAIYISVFSQ